MDQERKSAFIIIICVWVLVANRGCRILTAHGPNESVEKKDLLEAVEGYKKLILRALQ
jgi:acetylornithine deacetylase/succinyl-diaminopimelate desuccinylase-like protein